MWEEDAALYTIGRGGARNGQRGRGLEVAELVEKMLCFMNHTNTHTLCLANFGNFSGIGRLESVGLPTTVCIIYNPETLSSFHRKTMLHFYRCFREMCTNIHLYKQLRVMVGKKIWLGNL